MSIGACSSKTLGPFIRTKRNPQDVPHKVSAELMQFLNSAYDKSCPCHTNAAQVMSSRS